jgi:integral membrane sensor domain MASE1
MAGLALVYFLAARLGLSMAFPVEQVSAVWPPTGVALAALFLFGARLWPGVAVGALAVNLLANEPLLTAWESFGNTLEAIAGPGSFSGLSGFARPVERCIALIILGAAGHLVSASIGVTSLCSSGVHPWSSFGYLWYVWWLGDAMGDLVVAPALMVWATSLPRGWAWSRALSAAGLFAGLVLSTGSVFLGNWLPSLGHSLAYIVFPFVIWAALRFGPRGTTLVGLLASGIAILGTVAGWGPYSGGTVGENLVALQMFQCVVNVTGLLLAATMTERASVEKERNTLLVREQVARLEAGTRIA